MYGESWIKSFQSFLGPRNGLDMHRPVFTGWSHLSLKSVIMPTRCRPALLCHGVEGAGGSIFHDACKCQK